MIYKSSILAALFGLAVTTAFAQNFPGNNSPYSALGVGDLRNALGVGQQSMGGLSATYSSFNSPNFANPASYANLRYASFEAGAFYSHFRLSEKSTGKFNTANDGGLEYLSISMPINKTWFREGDTTRRRQYPVQWGMGFSFLPYSNISYVSQITNSDAGGTINLLEGEGNLQKLSWSNGVSWRGLSAGLSLGYLFGRLEEDETLTFTSSNYASNYRTDLNAVERYKAFAWSLGFKYDLVLDKKKPGEDLITYRKRDKNKIIIGAFLNNTSKVTRDREETVYRYSGAAPYFPTDTVVATARTQSSFNLPTTFGFGLSYVKDFKWNAGVNYEMSIADNTLANTANSWNLSAGMEWTPNYAGNFVQRTRYRLGGFVGSDYRTVSTSSGIHQLEKMGVSAGLGLFFFNRSAKDKPAYVNLHFEYGKMGNAESISTDYFKVGVGLIFNDASWFSRSRYR